jgi:hypothetical protein
MMGGQECFKHAKETGIRCNWTRIKRGVQGQRRHVCGFWITFVVDCVK